MYKISRKNNGWLNCPRLVIFALFMSLITVTGCSSSTKGNGGSVEPLEKFTLANFPTTPPEFDTWIISDTTGTTEEFANLRTTLLAAAGRKIELEFPNIIEIPDNAFTSDTHITSLLSVSAPQAIIIGESAFDKAGSSLTTIDLPQAITIGRRAFSGAIALGEVVLPKAETIAYEAFLGASALTSVDLKEATSIAGNAFLGASSLREVILPKAETIDAKAFGQCPALTSVLMLQILL